MPMPMPLRRFATAVQLCAALLLAPTALAAQPESDLVARARELVDTYYGGPNLERAAALLAQAYAANPDDAHIYVQAARITVMGGHIGFGKLADGTVDRYGALVDKALALDPGNAKAHILKAEVFHEQRRFADQFAELEIAKALDSTDPWVQMGYGRYYKDVEKFGSSYGAFEAVIRRGPGTTPSERKAYVFAASNLSLMPFKDERIEERLRKYAALAVDARYPADAWTPHGFAESFIDFLMFEDAIEYTRLALKTMDFGAGRRTLAAALYGRAAQLKMAGSSRSDIEPLLAEAKSMGYSKTTLLEYLIARRGYKGNTRTLEPTLRELIP